MGGGCFFFYHSVVSDSLQPRGLWHARLHLLRLLPSFLTLRFVELVMPSCHSPSPPAPSPSQHQGLFQCVSSCIRWPKYWSFSISSSSEYSGLISFRMHWLDLLAVQGTLRSLLRHHSSKASMLQRSVFLMAKLSSPHMTPGKTTALTIQTSVGKVMFLLFNALSRFVIPPKERLLIVWLH